MIGTKVRNHLSAAAGLKQNSPKKYPAARGQWASLLTGYCRLRFLWFGHDPYGDEPSRKILLLL